MPYLSSMQLHGEFFSFFELNRSFTSSRGLHKTWRLFSWREFTFTMIFFFFIINIIYLFIIKIRFEKKKLKPPYWLWALHNWLRECFITGTPLSQHNGLCCASWQISQLFFVVLRAKIKVGPMLIIFIASHFSLTKVPTFVLSFSLPSSSPLFFTYKTHP